MAVSRDLFWVAGGRVLSALIALVAIRYSTSVLPPEQYGELALLIAIQLFCGLFMVNPIGQHINRKTFEWWDAGELLSRLYFYPLYIFVAAIVGAVGVGLFGAQEPGFSTALAIGAMILMVVSASWNGTSIPLLNMLGNRAASATWSVASAASGLMASVFLLHISPSAIMWFTGQAIGMAVGAFGASLIVRHMAYSSGHLLARLPLITPREVYSYCLPLAIATGLMWAQLSGWRFLVEHYWGPANLGFMVVGLLLASQLWSMAESLLMQYVAPLFFRRVEDGEPPSLVFSDLLNLQLPLYFLLAGATIAGSAPLLELFVADQYEASRQFLIIGAIVESCRVIGNVFSNAAHVTRKTRLLALPYALGASSQFGLVAIAYTAHADIDLVGLALAFGGALMVVVMAVVMYREVNYKVDTMRWTLALIGALALIAMPLTIGKLTGKLHAISELMFIGILTMGSIFFILRKSPALERFQLVKLRVG